MLPARMGFSPYLLVFKQHPAWHGMASDPTLEVPDITDQDVEELIAQQVLWWDTMVELVRKRLKAQDVAMVREYAKRADLADQDLRFCFEPGDKVLVRQRVPGKLQTKAMGPYLFLRYIGQN